MNDQPLLIRRPPWWRLFARRRWERHFGTAPAAALARVAVPQRKPRSLKGVRGA